MLKQPTPWGDERTDYARPDTPYFLDVNAASPDHVTVVTWIDRRCGSYMGDYDDWDRSTEYALPAGWFITVLAQLQPGREICAQGLAELVKTDQASGFDCDNPHCEVNRQEVPIMLRLELSADMQAVTLTLLQQENGGWVPLTQLRQTESGAGTAPTVIL